MSRGANVFARVITCPNNSVAGPPPALNDVFLHSMFARLAFSDNSTVEFETKYDKATNTIELLVPADKMPIFNQITGMKRGDNMQCFVNWLIGSRAVIMAATNAQEPGFVPSSALQVWIGGKTANLDGDRLVIVLPEDEPAVVGHNLKTMTDFQGTMRVYLMWAFIHGVAGPASSFWIRTSALVAGTAGTAPMNVVGDVEISTHNLLEGDERETLLLDTGNQVGGENIIHLLVHRLWDGSPDTQTETVGIVGLRVEFEEA
ncbi:MAG: hypothetical protein Q8K86_00165 [Candidatus Nanopelagicaceae bacterium]|nr:hypothetical protein [Candidatus Nanopelagicaceae bacterium]